MTGMVQLAVARDVAEAEEMQAILARAGIAAELESAVEHHPAATDDTPTKVLVPETSLEDAKDAIEAMTEPDDLIAE